MQISFILVIYLLRVFFSGGSHIKVSDMPRECILSVGFMVSALLFMV